MNKATIAFWDRVAACKHENIYPDYCEGFPCANELCRGMATHCKDCKVFIFECACGFENGMSGHPYPRHLQEMQGGRKRRAA